jgi:hypothetical protein
LHAVNSFDEVEGIFARYLESPWAQEPSPDAGNASQEASHAA